ncbi:hypothetical protein [Cognaticolwellia mytili]|uniref:hypothetical protein n=1 Tax=Cognaticolwellia mytili TaxID=1888913 RepID=UPI000A177721|nr:hypothetical protein [Cognaticolwellia mytili]
MIEKELVSVLNKLSNQAIFFGPQGFMIVDTPAGLEEAQYGFGKDEAGNDLSGSNTGDWQASWLIIARDTELGDPYFIDASQAEYPVYTAFLGESGWEVELVATSLLGFIHCMNLLHSNGEQAEAQFVPDDNTIVDEAVLASLQKELSECAGNQSFWKMFFNCYQDWLLED